MTRRWWRRNAVALIALVILVPTGVWAFDQIEGGLARSAQHTVAPGESIRVGDWTFAPPTIESVDPAEVGAPAGSDPVMVRVSVTPGRDDVLCDRPGLVDPATGREWATSFGLEAPSGADDIGSCSPDSPEPVDLATLILLPADGAGGLDRLTVTVPISLREDEVRSVYRFDVVR